MTHATPGVSPPPLPRSAWLMQRAPSTRLRRPVSCVRSFSFVLFKFQNRRYERATLVISAIRHIHFRTSVLVHPYVSPSVRMLTASRTRWIIQSYRLVNTSVHSCICQFVCSFTRRWAGVTPSVHPSVCCPYFCVSTRLCLILQHTLPLCVPAC